MKARISASKLPMLAACPGAAALPWTESSSKWSTQGTSLHRFIATALESSVEDALADVPPELHVRCAAIDLGAIAPMLGGVPEAEVAFAWDPDDDQAVVLGSNLARDYSRAPEGWLVGTADLVVILDDVAVVADIKAGPRPVEHPSRHLQLRYQAIAAARANDCSTARAIIIRIDEDTGELYALRAEFDEMDLDGIAAELRGLLDRVEEASRATDLEEHISPGEHCGYCPAFSRCPAQARTALAIIDDDGAELTPELVPVIYQRLQAVESACRKVREAVRGYVLRHPVMMPNGKQLRIERTEQDEVVAAKALPIIAEVYGADVATAAASTSKSAIEEAVGKGSKAAIQLLRDRGAIRKRPVDKLVTKEPLPDDLEADLVDEPEPVAVAASPSTPPPAAPPAPKRQRSSRPLI